MTLQTFRGRCHVCGHDHDSANKAFADMTLAVGDVAKVCINKVVDVKDAELTALRARCEAAEKAAERYRWLNRKDNFLITIEDKPCRLKCGKPLNDWIDAAIAKEQQP